MEPARNTLDEINDENNINQSISQDEEQFDASSKQAPMAFTEQLIQQLPKNNEGRNKWLMEYGSSDEARTLRNQHKANVENQQSI